MNLHKLISSSKDTSGDFIDMDVNAEWDKFQKKIGYTDETKKAKQTLDRRIIRYAVAASILGIGVLIYILLFNNKKTVLPEALQESSDLVIHQTLPDGSVLDMSTDAVFELNNFDTSSLRQVIFKDGFGKFSVVHDSLVPFVVIVGALEVKVVGTVFTIDKSDSALTVHTLEGLVSVTSHLDSSEEKIMVYAGEFYTFQMEVKPGLKVKETNTGFFTAADSIAKRQFFAKSKSIKKSEDQRSTYYLEHLIKFLQRKHHGKFKLARRTKFDKKARIKADLNADLTILVQSICEQSNLKARPGKCRDCIELYIEKKK